MSERKETHVRHLVEESEMQIVSVVAAWVYERFTRLPADTKTYAYCWPFLDDWLDIGDYVLLPSGRSDAGPWVGVVVKLGTTYQGPLRYIINKRRYKSS